MYCSRGNFAIVTFTLFKILAPLLHFFKKIKKSFADIKNVYIFAMSIKTKPTGRVAGTKK